MSYLLFPSSSLFSLASATTQGVHGGIRGWAVGGSVRRGGGGQARWRVVDEHGWVTARATLPALAPVRHRARRTPVPLDLRQKRGIGEIGGS